MLAPTCMRLSCRGDSLQAVLRKQGVLLTTYGMILHNAAALSQGLPADSEEPLWDILILYEVCCLW
jgi:hypothetical protein